MSKRPFEIMFLWRPGRYGTRLFFCENNKRVVVHACILRGEGSDGECCVEYTIGFETIEKCLPRPLHVTNRKKLKLLVGDPLLKSGQEKSRELPPAVSIVIWPCQRLPRRRKVSSR